MNYLIKSFLTTIIAFVPLIIAVQPLHAISPNYSSAALLKISSEGFNTCKALRNSGFKAIARGYMSVGGGEGASGQFFHIRACFESKAECNNFINTLPNKIASIEQFYSRKCITRP